MPTSKLEHVVNILITPVRKSTGTPLLCQQVWKLCEREEEKSCVVQLGGLNHVNEDTRHGCVQPTERGGFLRDRRSTRQVSVQRASALWWMLNCSLRKSSPSLCVSRRVIQSSGTALLTQWSLCAHRYANSWPV